MIPEPEFIFNDIGELTMHLHVRALSRFAGNFLKVCL